MKKLNILLMGLAAFAMSSCEDAPGIAQPEVLPEPPAFTDGDVTIAVGSDLTSASNLQTIAAAGSPFTVATVQSVENLPEGATLSFGLQLADNDGFANYQEVNAPVVDNTDAQAAVLLVNNAIKRIFGNVMSPVTVNYRIAGYAIINNGIYRLGDANTFYGNGTVSVTPIDNPVVSIELGENLTSKAINLQQLSDDAVETIDVATITPASGMYEGYELSVKYLMSSKEDMSDAVEVPAAYDAETGVITVTTEDWISGQQKLFGATGDDCKVYWGIQVFYTFEGDSYNISGDNNFVDNGDIMVTPLDVPRHLGTPNDSQGWDPATSQWLLATDYDADPSVSDVYTGYAYFGGQWGGKFTNDYTGSVVWYGLDGEITTDPETGVITGNIKDGGGNILEGSTPALYWCDVNLGVDPATFSLTPVKSFSIIGDATVGGWSEADETAMTPSADFLTWTVETTLKEGSFKFRANNGWTLNLGGTLDKLSQNGDNIKTTVTGDVTITLYLGSVPYRATIVAR